jgi:hypothetical protein
VLRELARGERYGVRHPGLVAVGERAAQHCDAERAARAAAGSDAAARTMLVTLLQVSGSPRASSRNSARRSPTLDLGR